MKKWEYHITAGSQTQETLNSLGNEGWELVTVYLSSSGGYNVFVFKRPKP